MKLLVHRFTLIYDENKQGIIFNSCDNSVLPYPRFFVVSLSFYGTDKLTSQSVIREHGFTVQLPRSIQ